MWVDNTGVVLPYVFEEKEKNLFSMYWLRDILNPRPCLLVGCK
jgi:hypothetical protein